MIKLPSEPLIAILRCCFAGEAVEWPVADESFVDELLDVALQHGLKPLLWHQHAKSGCLASAPDALLQQLSHTARQESINDMMLEEELERVLTHFADVTIEPLLMKGTPLSFSLYPAAGLRPRCDTDLLIPKKQRAVVDQLMRNAGYESLFSETDDAMNSQSSYSKKGEFGAVYSFDIHRNISNAGLAFSEVMSYDYLLDRSLAVPALGEFARTLCNVDALLLAVFHRAGHFAEMGEKLIWLYDIHLLCGELNNDEWRGFLDKSRELQIQGISLHAFQASIDWFKTSIPDDVLQSLDAASPDEPSMSYIEQTGRAERIKTRFELDAGSLPLSGKVTYIWQQLFPSADYMFWRYQLKNRWQLPWYYLKRVFQGVKLFLS